MENYRKSKNEELTEDEKDTISENINSVFNLKGHILPVFDIKFDADEESVSNIFVRINSGGVPLKQNDFILTLLSIYWDEGCKKIEKFSKDSTLFVSRYVICRRFFSAIVNNIVRII